MEDKMKRDLYSSLRFTIVFAIVLAGLSRSIVADEVQQSATSQIDCGPAAIHALFWAAGRPVSIDEVIARLPSRPEGHSMKELQDASAGLGMSLEGRFIGKDIRALDRPMLAFIKDDSLRHFLVIRPVGPTGSLVQVIDVSDPPQVMDKTDLVASSQWTGAVLIPKQANWIRMVGWFLLATSSFVGWRFLAERRSAKLARLMST